MSDIDWHELARKINTWGNDLGFSAIGFSNTDLGEHEQYLSNWLSNDYHGSMEYMARHGEMRSHPALLHPNTISVISLRID